MPLRKHQADDHKQEDGAVSDADDKDEFSLSLLPSAREKRRKERENKSKPKEMTEDEMIDLALRLSEREAGITASRLKQEEEEAVMKAIQDSIILQTQPSHSQSLLSDAEASLGLCSRRKLSYSDGKRTSPGDQAAPEDDCPPGTNLHRAKDTGDENNRSKKRKRKEGSPLPEMPDLSQTQKMTSSCESLPVLLDSPQSSDSTQIDDELPMSPVFPLTGRRATVHVPRLSQDLLESCKTSGFVFCSEASLTWSTKDLTACPRSPDTDEGEDETELGPDYVRSPVFGRTSPSACKPRVCENSGFVFPSQESPTSPARSRRTNSPVFPRSPGIARNHADSEKPVCRSPVFSETERSHGCCTNTRREADPDVRRSSAAELGGPTRSRGRSPQQGGETDLNQNGRINITASSKSGDTQELNEISKGCNSSETELTSDMTLLWSGDDDDDVTPVGSPSPVFPEERPVHQADNQTASLNHKPAGALGTTVSNCRQQLTAIERQPQPAGGSTVHYYWGVPFCPRGLDPDSYTQVILAQMEVYEKSLKQAQRCLLRKAEWGEPVLPQPEKSPSPESPGKSPQRHAPGRRGLRLRGKPEDGDASPAETEEQDKKEEEDMGEDGRVEADDCEVCPETQLSDDDATQDPTAATDGGAQVSQQICPESPELTEDSEILRDDSPAAVEPPLEEEMEVDAPADGNAEANVAVGRNVEGEQGERDVEELQRSESPALEPAAVPRSPETSVDCPICQGSFPVTEIEIHAAYCDGEVAIVDEKRPEVSCFQASLKPRRRRTRRADVPDEDTDRNQEKCYICQRTVPLRAYSHHIELCIQRRTSSTDTRGNLLSALEQSEKRDSEAGPSKPQPDDVIDLRDDEEKDGVSAFRISNSPIRSFTPISEAADCLVDFRNQQRDRRPSRRRRRLPEDGWK